MKFCSNFNQEALRNVKYLVNIKKGKRKVNRQFNPYESDKKMVNESIPLY